MTARLEWSAKELLNIFPFRHSVELAAIIRPDSLTLKTTLVAGSDGPVPLSFGFHPYLRLPELSRANWHLELPEMRKLVLDARGIPNGDEESFGGSSGQLGENGFDDGFALPQERTSFSVAGAAYTVGVDFLEGYRYAQVFAPKDKDYTAFELMTAPTSALTTGHRLRFVDAGEQFRAVFRILIDGPH
jgi:aldose 1-epimerase